MDRKRGGLIPPHLRKQREEWEKLELEECQDFLRFFSLRIDFFSLFFLRQVSFLRGRGYVMFTDRMLPILYFGIFQGTCRFLQWTNPWGVPPRSPENLRNKRRGFLVQQSCGDCSHLCHRHLRKVQNWIFLGETQRCLEPLVGLQREHQGRIL